MESDVSMAHTPPTDGAGSGCTSSPKLFRLSAPVAMPYLRGVNVELSPAPRLPPSKGERWFVLLMIALFGAFLVAEMARDYAPRKLGLVFMALAWMPMIAIHEAGHAIVARLVGWRVSDMVVGFGRELVRFQAGETRVRIQLAPFGGYVIPSPSDLSSPRIKSAVIYAAGPGAEALVAGLLWMSDPELFSGADSTLRIAMRAIVYVAGISLFFNLLPMPAGGGANDGLGILLSLTLRPHHIRERLIGPELREATHLLFLEKPLEALEVLEGVQRLHGEDPRVHALAAVGLARSGRKSEAQERLDRAAELESQAAKAADSPDTKEGSIRATMHAYRAWTFLEMGDAGLVSFAHREAREAFEQTGGEVLPSVLYGRALLARGENRKAYGALMFGFKRASVSEEEGLCAAYLALAAHRALASGEPRTRGTPHIAADHPGRFLSALDQYVVGSELRQSVYDEIETYRERKLLDAR